MVKYAIMEGARIKKIIKSKRKAMKEARIARQYSPHTIRVVRVRASRRARAYYRRKPRR